MVSEKNLCQGCLFSIAIQYPYITLKTKKGLGESLSMHSVSYNLKN